MQFTAGQIAQFLGGQVEGDANVAIDRPAKIEDGGEGAITFLANPKYEPYIYTTTASAVLVSRDFIPEKPVATTLIRVDNVYGAVAMLLEEYGRQQPGTQEGVSSLAFVHPDAVVEAGATIGPFTVVEQGARIGKNTRILSQVYIGQGTEIGAECLIYPGVKIYHQCRIGQRCVIHANTVIGSDGFGFSLENGAYKKIAQIGNVIVEDDVEIGANTVIDRATMGSTLVRKGVKIDNLVQVAHNVQLGAHTAIAAQSGIAGSSQIGEYVQIGGQVGIIGHIRVADKVRIQAQSGVLGHVTEEGKEIGGAPAYGYREFLKAFAYFKQLPDLEKRLRALERQATEPGETK
jgi:UDP-3-O-[3-hydroxymyristoyl] glucosamine N-acyltransferase